MLSDGTWRWRIPSFSPRLVSPALPSGHRMPISRTCLRCVISSEGCDNTHTPRHLRERGCRHSPRRCSKQYGERFHNPGARVCGRGVPRPYFATKNGTPTIAAPVSGRVGVGARHASPAHAPDASSSSDCCPLPSTTLSHWALATPSNTGTYRSFRQHAHRPFH